MVLAAHNLSVDKRGRRILDDVSLTLNAGEMVALIGPNGAGKSTLVRTLLQLEHRYSGKVTVGARDVQDMRPRERARWLGYLPQNPEIHWSLGVGDVVALGRLPYADPACSSDDVAAIEKAIDNADLGDLVMRRCDSLSGGELARVHLARVLAGQHRIVIADEPIANLDPKFQLEILELLRGIASSGGAVLLVLHDLNIAARRCDRVVLLNGGVIRALGKPDEVLTAALIEEVFDITPLEFSHGR